MIEHKNVLLHDIIISIARSIVEANRILSEDEKQPTFISEFNVKTTFSATIDVERAREGFYLREKVPIAVAQAYKPAKFASIRHFTPQEMVLTDYKEELGVTIDAKIIAMPRTIIPDEGG